MDVSNENKKKIIDRRFIFFTSASFRRRHSEPLFYAIDSLFFCPYKTTSVSSVARDQESQMNHNRMVESAYSVRGFFGKSHAEYRARSCAVAPLSARAEASASPVHFRPDKLENPR